MRAVIITNGFIGSGSFVKNSINLKQDFIICADGGSEYAIKVGIIPNVIIGDLDSIKDETAAIFEKKDVPFIKRPHDQDKTDTELAIDYALEKGYKEILLLGGFGGRRIDHTLANVILVTSLAQKGIKIKALDEYNELHVCLDRVEVVGKPGDYLSLIPITFEVSGVSTTGLAYKLHNGTLSFGSTLSISNYFTEDKSEIKIENGILLVIRSNK